MYRIEKLDTVAPKEIFREIGRLHVELIHHGILEALGAEFVQILYEELSTCTEMLMYVALHDQQPVGFLAGSTNVRRSLRDIRPGGLAKLFGAACLQLWRPRLLKKAIQTLGYFFRNTKTSDNRQGGEDVVNSCQTEVLAIAVSNELQGQGVGKSLIAEFEKDLRNLGTISRYMVSTNVDEAGSNAFYRAAGFKLVGQKPHHALVLNVYAKDLPA